MEQNSPFPQISLRAVEPDDIDFLYRIENLPEIWSISWGDAPVSRHLLWEYINSYSADIYTDRQLQLIIESDGRSVGTIDITDFNPRHARAMIGVAIDPAYRGRGIAHEALSQIIPRCRDTFAMHQLCALVPKDNEASIRLFTGLGFKTSGCLKSWQRRGQSWIDVVVLQLML